MIELKTSALANAFKLFAKLKGSSYKSLKSLQVLKAQFCIENGLTMKKINKYIDYLVQEKAIYLYSSSWSINCNWPE